MLATLSRKIFGSRNDRLVKRLLREVGKINALEATVSELSDQALRDKTAELRQRHGDGETLSQLLPEAFALVREAGKRTLQMRHFDVQLVGGMVLHQGKIAEMRTGEGKTLVATLPVYLNALESKGTHVVTVNDYLARRDAGWMEPIYRALGLTVGVIVAGLTDEQRREAYAADVTYGTNNEFGFDYLRDNMKFSLAEKVQRPLHYAIVDEVDSILIDEARTPLVISGATAENSAMYRTFDTLVAKLSKQETETDAGDYSLEEKQKQVYLTEQGHDRVESLMLESGLLKAGESLYDASHIVYMHHLNAALRARAIFQRDVDYIVRDNQVFIVDEFTGRTMPGRRWSEGLHQAIEAKEGVPVQQESQTLASTTFQNYFRLYNKLAGMTGTADTEAYEFQQIYSLEVAVIPTHLSMIRDDRADLVYLTQEEKYQAIINDIKDCVQRGQPVLVGTTSIETSELISKALDQTKIFHRVLNAKQHEQEAQIIAQAGRPGSVTIATNMAGRGTDIVLGGDLNAELSALGESANDADYNKLKQAWQARHDQVVEAGGLHIVGTERHESRRIDNQLRGRSGRQGDPGSSRFYLSLRDNLMRIFASDRVAGFMQKLGMEEGEAIEHPWVSKAIENAQRKVEAHNFDMRKHLLEYDDIANDQRKVIYTQRDQIMGSGDVSAALKDMRVDVVNSVISEYIPPGSLEEEWDAEGLQAALEREFSEPMPAKAWLDQEANLNEEGLRARVIERLETAYVEKEAQLDADHLRRIEKAILLEALDTHWKEHLAAMDYLRQSVGLQGYAQRNPKQEFKKQSFYMFSQLLEQINREVIAILSRIQIRDAAEVEAIEAQQRKAELSMDFQHATPQNPTQALNIDGSASGEAAKPFVRQGPKIGRNQPCWCGSGKKFKQCHGRL